MQNNHYWGSQNPHLTHKVLLHPVKDGARWIVVPAFNETIHYKSYLRVEGQHFQHLL
jgi:hypothetical protein